MRCEGWVRHGGAFSLGPVTWSQCENEGEFIVSGLQKDGEEGFSIPACKSCWETAIKTGHIEILSVVPIPREEVK